MSTKQTGEEGFFWFFALVEDIEDPKQLGRVKVRVINEHDTVETDDLLWAHVFLPTTSACVEGVGDTPYLVPGSRVFGFFADGHEKQQPIVTHSIPVIPDNDDNKHSLTWLHRAKNIIEKELVGPEPESSYSAQYPYNRIIQTKSGHVIELDDTPENERVHIYHKGGCYIEINKDDQMIIKTVGENYEIVGKNQTIHIEGNQDVTIKGNQTVLIEGNQDVTIEGSQTVDVKGSQTINVDGSVDYTVGGTTTIDCSQVNMTGNLTVDGTITGGKVRTEAGIDLDTHVHTGVAAGAATSGPPQ